MSGCGKTFEDKNWWNFCGETDMGQSMPALCTNCGGKYPLNKVQICEACEGTGKDYYSCCGVDMRGYDIDLCPECYEHTGYEGLDSAEDCSECDGTGKTKSNE